MEHILITGSSGYLGQHLLSYLCQNEHALATDSTTTSTFTSTNNNDTGTTKKKQPSVIITAAYGRLRSFGEAPLPTYDTSRLTIRRVGNMDLTSAESVLAVFQEAQAVAPVTAVVHLAAMSSPSTCEFDPEEAKLVNCPTNTLWPAIQQATTITSIVFLSTDQVYRGNEWEAPYAETDKRDPVNVYGKTKLQCERQLLCEFDYSNTTSVYILRSSLMLGPPAPLVSDGDVKASFLQFIQARLEARLPTDYFTDEIRSAVHVYDVLRTVLFFLNNSVLQLPVSSGIYNLGGCCADGSSGVSRVDMARAVASRLGLSDEECSRLILPTQRFTDGNGREEKVDKRKYYCKSPPNISMNMDKLFQATGNITMNLDQIVEQVFPNEESRLNE